MLSFWHRGRVDSRPLIMTKGGLVRALNITERILDGIHPRIRGGEAGGSGGGYNAAAAGVAGAETVRLERGAELAPEPELDDMTHAGVVARARAEEQLGAGVKAGVGMGAEGRTDGDRAGTKSGASAAHAGTRAGVRGSESDSTATAAAAAVAAAAAAALAHQDKSGPKREEGSDAGAGAGGIGAAGAMGAGAVSAATAGAAVRTRLTRAFVHRRRRQVDNELMEDEDESLLGPVLLREDDRALLDAMRWAEGPTNQVLNPKFKNARP